MEAEPVDQVVGKVVQEQTKRIGQEAMTAKPVGMEAVLELFDPVLALPALVIEAKHLGTAAGAVGNQEKRRLVPVAECSALATMRRSRGQVRARWRKLVKERWGRWERR